MSLGQGCYTSAMGILDWLDTSYSPVQLIAKYKLPTLVRITEGYYGNNNTNCFSAMDVIKLHEIQRVDMIVAKLGTDTSDKDPNYPGPTRVCFPTGFTGRFDPIQVGDRNNKRPKLFKTVRKVAEFTPHYVRVLKKPCKKEEAVEKGDVLEILGLSMCNGWWDEHGFLRCRKQGGDEVHLNLKWRGLFETIPDPEGYTLQDILKRFMMPCQVNLRSPESHIQEGSDLITLLPQLGGSIILEREITNEFLVGTVVGLESITPQNPISEAEKQTESPKVKSPRQQSVVVLSKNANVLFQICQDMVHKRAIYMSLLEKFEECCMDKIPLECFICEYAAPFVTFTRTYHTEPSIPQPRMTARPHSRSTPDLTIGRTANQDQQVWDPTEGKIDHNYAYPAMMNRALPLLPHEVVGMAKWHKNRTIHGAVPVRDLVYSNVDEENKISESNTLTNDGSEDEESVGAFVDKGEDEKAAPLEYRTSPETSRSEQDQQGTCMAHPVLTHPEPPQGFDSSPGHVEDVESAMQGGDKNSYEVADSPNAPPNRKPPPPPPPPRTTPRILVHEGDLVYRNLDLVAPGTSSSPPTPKSSPPATPARGPIVPQSRRARTNVIRRGSHSFSTIHDLSSLAVHQPSTRHLSPCVKPPKAKSSHGVPSSGRPSSVAPGGYLQPLLQKGRFENPSISASSRSHSSGSLLEEVDLAELSANEASKTISSSAPSRPITTCKPTRRIATVYRIPSDVGKLSTSELAQCLRLLKLDEDTITRFRDYQINGSLLIQLTSKTVHNELALTEFEAEKVDAFRRGWRPDFDS